MTDGTHAFSAASSAVEDVVQVKRILLLDGVRLFLKLEETLLQRNDHELFAATSAAEALEILDREDIDLILMDYVLPDMTGEEMVKHVRQHPRNGQAGIVIVTARGMREHVDACMRAGCNGFLFKPVNGPELTARVQEVLKVPARRHVRTLVRLQVNAHNRDRFFFGSTVNLSEGGMLLQTPLDLAVGEAMNIRFFLPGEEQPVACSARITRRGDADRAGEHAYGLSFDEIEQDSRSRIARFVEAQQLEPTAG